MDWMQSWWNVVEDGDRKMINPDITHFDSKHRYEVPTPYVTIDDMEEGSYLDNEEPGWGPKRYNDHKHPGGGPFRFIGPTAVTYYTLLEKYYQESIHNPHYFTSRKHGIQIAISPDIGNKVMLYKDGLVVGSFGFDKDFNEMERPDWANEEGYLNKLSGADFKCPEDVTPCPPLEIKEWV